MAKEDNWKSAGPYQLVRIIITWFVLMIVAACFSFDIPEIKSDRNKKMDHIIKITAGEKVLTAIMLGNKTSKDFINMLPLELSLEDYAGTEKISDLPKRLNTEDAPPGCDPSVGDITYYSPWGNLAIFYKDFDYFKGLVILGHINENISPLAHPGSVTVKIELME